MTLDQEARRQAELWGSGQWERLAEGMADIHDRLVAALDPQPGERLLDVATGTGAVALRAAKAGAEVTAQDLAPRLVDTARRLAAEQGLTIRFDVGDATRLPYGDASFDVVASAHGVAHVPDHRAVARELARVCRPGGRLGLSDWLPDRYPEFERMLAPFRPAASPGSPRRDDWGRPQRVRQLLDEAFELEFVEGNSPWTGASGEAIWKTYLDANGVARSWVESLEPERRGQLHTAWVEYFERHRTRYGIRAPRAYLLVVGRRRAGLSDPPATRR
jgi:SAM-dependent methyltransferase